jgi:hypothetical protein
MLVGAAIAALNVRDSRLDVRAVRTAPRLTAEKRARLAGVARANLLSQATILAAILLCAAAAIPSLLPGTQTELHGWAAVAFLAASAVLLPVLSAVQRIWRDVGLKGEDVWPR